MSLTTQTANFDNLASQNPCASLKDNVEGLLHTWSSYSSTLPPNDATLLGLAAEVCKILSRRNSFNALEVFLERLPKTGGYNKNTEILRSKIAVALKKRQAVVVIDIIKNNKFDDHEDLIKCWDEAHYIEEEDRLQKALTPLARFRVRKRHPPPKTICPSGMRKMASLPKGATRVLKQWLIEHYHDPYPTGEEKMTLAKLSGITSNQVKTWFANARRRIHKVEGPAQPKKSSNTFEMKESLRNSLINRMEPADTCGGVSLPSDGGSVFTPYFQSRLEHNCDGFDYVKMPGFGYRCLHSMFNSHGCLHCKDAFPDNTSISDNASSDVRSLSRNVNGNFPVHPTPGYTLPRWPYFSPVQYRHEDFDAWYRAANYQNDIHSHYQEFDPSAIAVERLGALDNSALIDSCLQSTGHLQAKASHLDITSDKDELTEVGAARILADLSSKQSFTLQYEQPGNLMSQMNHV